MQRFPVPDRESGCAIIELRGVVLGNISDVPGLTNRLSALLQREQREMKAYRLISKILSVMSIIILFYASAGVWKSAQSKPFLLIFALAAGVGLIAVGLRARCKTLSEEGLIRVP